MTYRAYELHYCAVVSAYLNGKDRRTIPAGRVNKTVPIPVLDAHDRLRVGGL